jgi:hypothetical protein
MIGLNLGLKVLYAFLAVGTPCDEFISSKRLTENRQEDIAAPLSNLRKTCFRRDLQD